MIVNQLPLNEEDKKYPQFSHLNDGAPKDFNLVIEPPIAVLLPESDLVKFLKNELL